MSTVNSPEFSITRCMLHRTMRPGHIHRPAGSEHYTLTFFTTPVTLWLGRQATQTEGHCLVCWAPGREPYFGNSTAPWAYSLIEISGNEVTSFLGQTIPLETVIHITHYTPVHHLLKALDALHAAVPDAPGVPYAVLTLLQHLQHLATHAYDTGIPHRIRATARYIETHYTDQIILEQLAEIAGISLHYFLREFSKYYKVSPIEYLVAYRLRQAEWLMFDESLTLSKIAQRTGYNDASYFSRVFHKRYGCSPNEYRNQLMRDASPARQYALQAPHEIDAFFRENWVTIYAVDFSRDTTIDKRLAPFWRMSEWPPDIHIPAPERIRIEQGALRILPYPHRTALVWQEDISEEIRIDVVLANTSTEGLNVGIAISGDMEYGYQLRLVWYSHLEIETRCHGYWEVLHRIPYALSPKAPTYHVSFWRSDNTFYVAIDGKQIVMFYDPAAPRGGKHRTFAISRYSRGGSAEILSIQVFKRQDPLYVDVLELGRALLRLGHTKEAQRHCEHLIASRMEPHIIREAQYLVALTETDPARRETLLLALITDPAHPFRSQALDQLILQYIQQERIRESVDLLIIVNTETARSMMTPHATAQFACVLRKADFARRHEILREIARAPITWLQIASCRLDTLDGIAGLPLIFLNCNDNQISDLTPLRGMPLQRIEISHNKVTDLSPLIGMPVMALLLTANSSLDFSTLPLLPLDRLECMECDLTSLAPLAGMMLRYLHISGNAISDLTPVRGMPLRELQASFNQITSLKALAGMPLQNIDLSMNSIHDITPLHGAPLHRVNLSYTNVTDLTPLRDAPLHELHFSHTPVTSLAPLAKMDLYTLHIGNAPLNEENILVLSTLPLTLLGMDEPQRGLTDLLPCIHAVQYLNLHHKVYVQSMVTAIIASYDAWRRADVSPELCQSLRQHAVRCGAHDYLAFPFPLTRAEAFDFARALGGYPACPATWEEHQALVAWLQTIIEPAADDLLYYLGLTFTPAPQWLSGATYQWQKWQEEEEAYAVQQGTALLRYNPIKRTFNWVAGRNNHSYLLIAWPT